MKGYHVWKHHWDDAEDEKIFLDLDKARRFIEQQNANTNDDWEKYRLDEDGIEVIE